MERYTVDEFEQLGEIGACICEGKKMPPWIKNKKDDKGDDDDEPKCKCGKPNCKCGKKGKSVKKELDESFERIRFLAESGKPLDLTDDEVESIDYETSSGDFDIWSVRKVDGSTVYLTVPSGEVPPPEYNGDDDDIDDTTYSISDFKDVDGVMQYDDVQSATAAADMSLFDGIPPEELGGDVEANGAKNDDGDDGDDDNFDGETGDDDDYKDYSDDDDEDDDEPDMTDANVEQLKKRYHLGDTSAPRRPIDLRKPLKCFGCDKEDSDGQMFLVRWNDGTTDWFCPDCYEEYKAEMDAGTYDGENDDGSTAKFDGIVKKAIPDLD